MAVSIPIISEFDGQGIKKAMTGFKNLEGAGKKASFAIKKAAIPAGIAIAALGAALFDAAKGAMDDAKAQEILATAIMNTTEEGEKGVKSAEDWITAQGKLLGFSDDKLRPAFARLVTSTRNVAEAQKLGSLAMDIAIGTGHDLATVSDALAKASVGNYKALQKISPELKDIIKEGASAEEIMNILGGTFGGQAATAAATAAGQFGIMKVALDESKESIGAALLPAIQAVLPFVKKLSDWAAANPQTFLIVGGAIAGIATSIMLINAAMALNPIGAIIIGVGALVAAVAIAYNKFEGFRNIVRTVVNGVSGYLETMANVWIKSINIIIRGMNILKPGKDIGSIGEVSFGTIGPEALPGASMNLYQNIPKLAAGGIVNSPTLALIGERGPEAVVPLNRTGGMGTTNVTINVNGGDPNQIINAIQRYVRQSGAVALTSRAI